jgi:hypothetical protein
MIGLLRLILREADRDLTTSINFAASGLLASLLLNFYSASLHGNSDGISGSGLGIWAGAG